MFAVLVNVDVGITDSRSSSVYQRAMPCVQGFALCEFKVSILSIRRSRSIGHEMGVKH